MDFPAVLCREDQACEYHFHETLMDNPSTLFSSILLWMLRKTKEAFAILFFENINATPLNKQGDKTTKIQWNNSIYDRSAIALCITLQQQTGAGVLEIMKFQKIIHLLTWKFSREIKNSN